MGTSECRTVRSTLGWPPPQRITVRSTHGSAPSERRTVRSTLVLCSDWRPRRCGPGHRKQDLGARSPVSGPRSAGDLVPGPRPVWFGCCRVQAILFRGPYVLVMFREALSGGQKRSARRAAAGPRAQHSPKRFAVPQGGGSHEGPCAQHSPKRSAWQGVGVGWVGGGVHIRQSKPNPFLAANKGRATCTAQPEAFGAVGERRARAHAMREQEGEAQARGKKPGRRDRVLSVCGCGACGKGVAFSRSEWDATAALSDLSPAHPGTFVSNHEAQEGTSTAPLKPTSTAHLKPISRLAPPGQVLGAAQILTSSVRRPRPGPAITRSTRRST